MELYTHLNDKAITIRIKKDIDTGFSAHTRLSQLAYLLTTADVKTVNIDLEKVNFIASNQFAILGCILNTYRETHPDTKIFLLNMKKKISETIQKNGFYYHLGLKKIEDTYNTVIPYTIFDIDKIDEFEKYILLRIFGRPDIPKMSTKVKNSIVDNILEIFNNVKEHTHSLKIYTCGQYFPRSSLLYFTVVDSGETIPYNVLSYFNDINEAVPEKTLEWAIQEGNSTRITATPGGLGLSLLRDFIELNQGKLYIVSGNETYEKLGSNDRHKYMDYDFPGTIVTVAFNLSDKNFYSLRSEDFTEIKF